LKSKFISLILSVAVILGLMLVPAALPTVVLAQADEWSYEIQPNLTKVGFDTDFTVDVKAVCYSGNSSSYFLAVAFNATLLNVTAVDTPANLPNGDVPSMSLGYPLWDNTTGFVAEQYSMQPPYEAPWGSGVTFTMCTIHFRSLGVEGTSDLTFANIDITNTTKVKFLATDTTNWTKMDNGTVMIGSPELEVDVSPRGWPPYPMATGGLGIAYNMSDPLNEDYMLKIYPYDPLPNYTYWAWDQTLIVAAVDNVPGWAFDHWTGTPGLDMPAEEVEVGGVNYTIHPRILVIADDSNLTAHNLPKAPEIAVNRTSLFFNPYEGINPPNQTLMLWNSGGSALIYSITDDAAWLSEDPTAGVANTSFLVETDNITVSVNVSGLSAGPYSANINITEAGDPANFTLVPVDLTVRPATAIDVCRNIMPNTTYSGHPGETDEVYPGEVINVYVNFTAPPTNPNHGFNAIGVTDLAPDGWTVTLDKTWSWINGSQEDAYAVDDSTDNIAQIMWTGPFSEGTTISGMYKVTVPTTADPGLNYWPTCDDDGMADAWVEYYFNTEGPHSSPICCDRNVTVTQPGNLVGETRDVNAAELADVDVQLHLVGPGYLWSDISSPDYTLTAWVTGEYWLVVNRTRYHQINASDAVDVPGLAFTIDLGNQTLLSDGNVFDFEGNFGLVPKACALTYVLRTVNLWQIGYPGHSEWTITEEWKVGDVINSWLYPS